MNVAADECAKRKASRRTFLISINGFFLVLIVAISLLVDANGRILGMNSTASIVTAVVVFTVALVAAAVLAAKGQAWVRWCGIALIVLYVLMLLPVLLP